MKKIIIDEILKHRFEEKKALIDDRGNYITYLQLIERSRLLANELKKVDRENVAIYLPNSISFVVAILGIWFANKTAIPVNYSSTISEVKQILNFCDTDCIISNIEIQTTNIRLIKETNISNDHSLSRENFCLKANDENDLALIIPTSGSTGNPKYVKISHCNIIDKVIEIRNLFGVTEKDRELVILPLSVITIIACQLLVALSCGATTVLYSQYINPEIIEKIIKKEKITYTGCTSSVLRAFLEYQKIDYSDFQTIRGLIIGGEMIDKTLILDSKKKLSTVSILPMYGLTETTSAIAGSIGQVPIGSVGKILPSVHVRIDKKNYPNSDFGEILVKGSTVMKGYFKNEELNRRAFSDGWLKTGDIGKIDENGYLYIKGRIKNVIISGGRNIFPEEIEEIIMNNKNIIQALVYSKKNSVLGEIPVADVVVKKGSNINETDIFNYCKSKMSSYKIPQKIAIRRKINLIGMGKISRVQSRDSND